MSIKSAIKKAVSQAIKQASQDIISKYDTAALRAAISDLPQKIRIQEDIVSINKRAYDDALEIRAQEEAILMSLIASEINSTTGKQVFTNKEARDAELIQRKKTSPQYLQADEKVKEAEGGYLSTQADLRKLQDDFKAKRIIARIACKELAALGLDDEEEDDNELY